MLPSSVRLMLVCMDRHPIWVDILEENLLVAIALLSLITWLFIVTHMIA
jgi:hypothetical protein